MLLAAILSATALRAADSSPRSTEAVVQEIVRLTTIEWPRANVQGDVKWFEQHLADELMLTTGRTGEVTTKAQELASIRASQGAGSTEKIEDLRVHAYGDTAVTTFKIDVSGTDNTGPYHRVARYTEVWVFRDGRWQLAASHSSLVPNQPPQPGKSGSGH